MSKKSGRNIYGCLLQGSLSIIILYLFCIGIQHHQEAKDAIWLCLICICGIIFLEIQKKMVGNWRVILNAWLIFGLLIIFSCEICIFFGGKETSIKEYSKADYIVILGSKLENNEISSALKARLQKGIDISKKFNIPIIVSGGNTKSNSRQEAEVMKEYLIKQEVQNDILVENMALNTRQNFEYIAEMVGIDSKRPCPQTWHHHK